MKSNLVKIIVCACIVLSIYPRLAEANGKEKQTNEIVIIYSMDSEQQRATVNQLDTLFSAYGKTVVSSIEKLTKEKIKQATHLVFVGLTHEEIAANKKQMIKEVDVPQLFIGKNATQFISNVSGKEKINKQLVEVGGKSLQMKTSFLEHKLSNEKVIVNGRTIDQKVPLFMKWETTNQYYLAMAELNEEVLAIIRPFLADDFIGSQMNAKKSLVIVGDITPQTKAKRLKERLSLLKAQNISYALAVTSAILEKGDNQRFMELKENKELIKELVKQQTAGVAILADGYAKTITLKNGIAYDDEFWSRVYDHPITSEDEQVTASLKKRSDFSSEKEFQRYRSEIGQAEAKYANQRINQAVNSLSDLGLYPIAFTTKSGLVSDYVYDVIENHFSSYFGKLQYSNEEKAKSGTQADITEPAYLNGLQVYPINLNEVTNERVSETNLVSDLQQLDENRQAIAGIQLSMLSSTKNIEKTLAILAQFPQFTSLDVGNMPAEVKTSAVHIQQNAVGEKQVEMKNKYFYRLKNKLQNEPFEFMLWGLFVVVLLFVIVFFINVLRLRVTLKKRLFEERKPNG